MTQFTTKNYIKYLKGDIPLIISAPHGGTKMPDEIKTRTSGVFDMDDYTQELTHDIIEEFENQTGKKPYTIIADISRKKVDLNREENEAYEDQQTKSVYNYFHNLIKDSKQDIEKEFDKGLYLDIHGQSHPDACIEFGYLLFNDTLKLYDTKLKEYQDKSSINTLSKFSKQSFLDQLKGDYSLGSLMCNQGYDSIPSTKLPYASDDNYFEGAYDTIKYGSLDGGNISGIQVEFPYKNVRDTKQNRKKCAKAFVSSILKYFEVHFDIKLQQI